MISKGYKYKIFNPKQVGKDNNKLVFQISDKGKDGKYRYVSFMAEMSPELEGMEHKDEIEIEEITGCSVSEYKGLHQFTMFGTIKRLANEEIRYDEEENDLGITEEDLPF